MFSPLEGVRVIYLTTSVAGPYCTLILGALGADTVKLEHPERGDDARGWGPPFWNDESALFLALNANKRSLAVDVKSSAGRDIVLRLVEGADVFVQNLRPGLAEALGLGFEALRERNPRIVYCSIGAFGSVGPLAHQPGYDPLMQAFGGIMSVTGEPGRPPVRAGVSVVDQGVGMWAVIAIVLALSRRDADGGAQRLDTSLFETAVNWLPYQIAGYLATGRAPKPLGSALGIVAPYQAFAVRDGTLMIAAATDRQFADLCRALELPELPEDSRFRTNRDRARHREELAALIAERLRDEDAATWLERLDEARVPGAPVQDIAQAVEHEQTKALGMLQPLPHPSVPDLRLVAFPLSFDGARVEHRTPAPALGEHSAEILAEAGYAREEIEALAKSGVVRIP